MSVVGIDFGSIYSVVAVVRRGIDIIDNEVSKRQTSSLVGFDEKKKRYWRNLSFFLEEKF